MIYKSRSMRPNEGKGRFRPVREQMAKKNVAHEDQAIDGKNALLRDKGHENMSRTKTQPSKSSMRRVNEQAQMVVDEDEVSSVEVHKMI